MKFDDVVIIWINELKNIKRHIHITELLHTYFPKNKNIHVNAIYENPKHNGVSMAHMIAILKGIKTKQPFIILEDDVNIDASLLDILLFENEIKKLDKLCDTVYIGLSNWGGGYEQKGENDKLLEKGALIEDINNNYFIKIKNMYGAHAILYISIEYAIETIKYCITAICKNTPHDILTAKLMKKYNVLGLRKPWFYQDSNFNGQEKHTKITII